MKSRERLSSPKPTNRRRSPLHRLIPAVMLATIVGGGIIGGTSPATAQFSDCPYGAWNAGGRFCLWSSTNYSGPPGISWINSWQGHNVGYRSFGNRVSNRCVRGYAPSGALALTATANTGNWHSDLRYINKFDMLLSG